MKSALRRLTAPLRCKIVILMYHRIFAASSDPIRLCVSPGHFAEHLEYLRSHYSIFTVRDLAGSIAAGQLPKRAIVLTFDDGYVDNLWYAKPLLERHDAPATIAITTGLVDQNREFWTLELERLLLLTPSLPERLQVTLNGGTTHEWDLGKWACLPTSLGADYSEWHVGVAEDPTPRHRAYRELRRLLSPLEHEAKEKILKTLFSQAGAELGMARAGYRMMTRDEIRQLAGDGLIEIGSHTVTHPVLAGQPVAAQQQEITQSKRFLEEVLEKPVTTFCYPYGGRQRVGRAAVKLVEEAGYTAACATDPAPVTRQANVHWLPRFMVFDWDGDEFAGRLAEFFQTEPRSRHE